MRRRDLPTTSLGVGHAVRGLVVVLAGCEFSIAVSQHADAMPDTELHEDAPIDSAVTERDTLYAVDRTSLYEIDISDQRARSIGTIRRPSAAIPLYLEGLAVREDGRLIGLPNDVGEAVYEIDPTTAVATNILDLDTERNYYGMAHVPAVGTFAATDAGSLYRVNPAGAPSYVGAFGAGRRIAGDMTWNPSAGTLLATVSSGSCPNHCIAAIDPATATLTVLADVAIPTNLWAMGTTADGKSYALSGTDGIVYAVDPFSGTLTELFTTGIDFSDAAP